MWKRRSNCGGILMKPSARVNGTTPKSPRGALLRCLRDRNVGCLPRTLNESETAVAFETAWKVSVIEIYRRVAHDSSGGEHTISIWGAPPFAVFEGWDPARSHAVENECLRNLWNPTLAAKNAARMGHPRNERSQLRTATLYLKDQTHSSQIRETCDKSARERIVRYPSRRPSS